MANERVTGEAVFSSFDGLHAEGTGALAPLGSARDLIEMRGNDLFAALNGGDTPRLGFFAQPVDFGTGRHLMLGVVQPTRDLSRRPALFGVAVSLRDIDTDLEPAIDALDDLYNRFDDFHAGQLAGRESTGAMGFFTRSEKTATTPGLRPGRTEIFRADPELSEYETIVGLLIGLEASDMAARRLIAVIGNPPETLPVLSAERIAGYRRIVDDRIRAARRAARAAAPATPPGAAFPRTRDSHHGPEQGGTVAAIRRAEDHAVRALSEGNPNQPPAAGGTGPAALLVGGLAEMIDGLAKSEAALGITGDAERLRHRLDLGSQTGALRQGDAHALLVQASAAMENLRRHVEAGLDPGRGALGRAGNGRGSAGQADTRAGAEINFRALAPHPGRVGRRRAVTGGQRRLLLLGGLALLALAGLIGLWMLRDGGGDDPAAGATAPVTDVPASPMPADAETATGGGTAAPSAPGSAMDEAGNGAGAGAGAGENGTPPVQPSIPYPGGLSPAIELLPQQDSPRPTEPQG